MTIKGIVGYAGYLKMKNPNIEHVYAIDNRGGLWHEYNRTVKHNSVEGNVIFKDTLEREGLLII